MELDPAVSAVLNELIAEMDDDNTAGFALIGSYARGEATAYSDIDFTRVVRKPITDYTRHYYLYRHDFVIEVTNLPLQPAFQDLTRPAKAIWFVQAVRQFVILQDKTGDLQRLQQAALDFRWEPLQEEANQYASYLLHERVETVRKLVGVLNSHRDELELQKQTNLLTDILTHLVAVQRGLMIKTGRTYYPQVQAAVGTDSQWTRYHLAALGIGAENASWAARSIASLQLYLDTARLLQTIIRGRDQTVIEYTVKFIETFLTSLT